MSQLPLQQSVGYTQSSPESRQVAHRPLLPQSGAPMQQSFVPSPCFVHMTPCPWQVEHTPAVQYGAPLQHWVPSVHAALCSRQHALTSCRHCPPQHSESSVHASLPAWQLPASPFGTTAEQNNDPALKGFGTQESPAQQSAVVEHATADDAHLQVGGPASPKKHPPLQQSDFVWSTSVHGLPLGTHAHTPPRQDPPQQLADSSQLSFMPLQFVQTPFAQTPLQHSVPVWQLPSALVHTHAPALHVPLQHGTVPQL